MINVFSLSSSRIGKELSISLRCFESLRLLSHVDTTNHRRDDKGCLVSFRYHVVAEIIGVLDRKAENQIRSEPESVIALLEVLKGLSHVANQLTTVASIRSAPNAAQDAEDMLVYYLGIINVAIGRNTTQTWKQVHFILLLIFLLTRFLIMKKKNSSISNFLNTQLSFRR